MRTSPQERSQKPRAGNYTRASKIENGVQAPTDTDIRNWCRACGTNDQVPDLIATLRTVESTYLEFRRQSRAGMEQCKLHEMMFDTLKSVALFGRSARKLITKTLDELHGK